MTIELRAEAKVVGWLRRWREVMTAAAEPRVGDRDAAEDIVQQASMTALSIARSNPDRVLKIQQPSSWLVRITRNVATGVLRTDARRRRLSKENGGKIRELFPNRDAEEDPRAERVREAAPRVLTKRQLEVSGLQLQGMEDDEIARDLGMKPETVRWHRTEAIRRLREHFSRSEGGGDVKSK